MTTETIHNVETKKGIARGAYHDGERNVFCIYVDDDIVCRSYSAYDISMAFSAIQNTLATVNNLYQLENQKKET